MHRISQGSCPANTIFEGVHKSQKSRKSVAFTGVIFKIFTANLIDLLLETIPLQLLSLSLPGAEPGLSVLRIIS